MGRIVGRTNLANAQSTVPVPVQGRGHLPGEEGRARARAARILLNARAQAREIIAAGQELGMAESKRAWELGYQAGSAQARSELAPLLHTLSQIVTSATQDLEQNMRSLDGTVLSLVMEVARMVLHREASISRETVLYIVRDALSELSADSSVAIRVNPLDVQILEEQRLDLGLPANIDVMIVADPAVSQGGCLIESGAGRVDATIEKQLARIRRHFDDHLSAC